MCWTNTDKSSEKWVISEFYNEDNNSKLEIKDEWWITWDETKESINNILEFNTIFENINKVIDYNDFSRFKEELISCINSSFHDKLRLKDDDFKLAFNQWNVSKYQVEDDLQKEELKILIKEKNKIYMSLLLKTIIQWKLDNILTLSEKNDLKNVIKTWIFSYFDDMYINWFKETYKQKDLDKKNNLQRVNKDWKLAYGWLKDWNIVWYKQFINDKELAIDTKYLESINDVNLRKYLHLFTTFIDQEITNYDLWVEAELFELETWKNKDSIFWLVTPIEDYNYETVVVEPEIILFLKDKEKAKNINLDNYCNLSKEFFWDNYWMDNMTLNFVETILEWWESSFSWFIGKAFPNDNALSEREWNSIILKNKDMLKIVENSVKWFKNLFWSDHNFDSDALFNELLKEVTYHEFGHSVFVKWHPSSKMEEAKATLFYYLQLFKENSQEAYKKEDITRIIEFTIMDSIRNLERIKQEKSFKYVVLTKINLMYLFASWLVEWEWEILTINASSENFNSFLSSMKDMIFTIKELYKLEDDKLKEKEELILSELDNIMMPNINKMIKVINK